MADLSNVSASTRFSVINPDLLPAMKVLETVDTEQIISNRLAQLVTLWNSYDPPNAATYDVGGTEFDPIRINQELNAYFELMVRDRVNQAARSITLAFAVGADLDAIGSRYPGGLPRLTSETDDHYRRRIWLSVNALSPHGTAEGYTFWALSANEGVLRDASAVKIRPDLADDPIVVVTCLAEGISTTAVENLLPTTTQVINVQCTVNPTDTELLAIRSYILDESRLAMTDVVSINKPKIKHTDYHIQVWLYPGPEESTVLAAVTDALVQLVKDQYWLGYDHTRMAISAACAQSGVYNATIVSPSADVLVNPDYIVQVGTITVEYMGRGE